jgi:hypothetical protein
MATPAPLLAWLGKREQKDNIAFVNDAPTKTSDYPRLLSGRTSTVGLQTATPALFLALFGMVFVAVGGAVIALSAGWIPAKESSFHAPRWILGCIGGIFAGAGLGVVWMGLRGPWRRWKLARNHRQFPNQPAMADFLWNPKGETQNRMLKVVQSLLGTVMVTAFLVPFNWWAFFSDDDTLMVKIVVGVFDVILVFCWWMLFHTLVWALKYGPARLTWDAFPLRRNAVNLRWEPGRGLRDWTRGTFTLRCIRERIEKVESKQETETRQLHECLWEEVREVELSRMAMGRGEAALSFTLPPDAQPTAIMAEQPVYWELEVKVAQPGVDFTHTYLVPIYA